MLGMVALTSERLWQEDLKLHANLGCILTPYLKQTTNKQTKQQPQMPQVLSQASDPLHEETDNCPGQLQAVVAMRDSAQE